MHQQRAVDSTLVPTRFVWPYGGHTVHVCGSFTNWLQSIPMAPDGSMSELGAQVFAVVCNLPPGYHQYKFVVDGEYRHDEAQLLMPDPLGNVNNWLFVKKVDTDTARMYHPNTTARSERGPSLGLKTTTLKHEVCMQSNNPGPVGVVGTMSGPLGVTFGEADASRARILEFLQRHTAYELLPESSKSIVLDTKLPVQQAYLTLHEHAISFAPLWNEESTCFAGMLSVDDFIEIFQHLSSDHSVRAIHFTLTTAW
mmetsp:Transcript_6124/g.21507  ORF Transcript_6124/g.21507 Transcript_6124/m.21507 type:complete len:254 (-) Transcript_6124:2652-3413(-)